MEKITTEIFIIRAKSYHGSKYDYSSSVYINATAKVKILCPTHGEFMQSPSNHTNKTHPQGCPICAKERKVERIRQIGINKKGTSSMLPLLQKDFATEVVQDLGMRQLKSRVMRYVELKCAKCGEGFEISCDNAKRRKENTCPSCKAHTEKTSCIVCNKDEWNMSSTLENKPNLKQYCAKCLEAENKVYKVFKEEERLSAYTICQYLYIDNGVVYKKSTNQPIDVSKLRPRVYGVKMFYAQLAYILYYGIIDNTVGMIDVAKGYTKENLVTGVASGGFKVGKPGMLYYLRVAGGTAYKIGITNYDVDTRYSVTEMQSIHVVKTWHYEDGKECSDQETRILREYKDFLYEGPDLLKSGNTELFTYDILNLDIEGIA